MFAIALLRAWTRIETREALGRLSTRLMISEGWLALAGLAAVLAASTYFADTELGPWRATPPLLTGYLRWYLELGGGSIALASMARFREHLTPRRPYTFLPYVAPLSAASLHIAPLAAATVANLIVFSVATVPALVTIGVWAGAGPRFYWLLLPAAVAVALSAALLGALLALPVAFILSRLHRRWRIAPANINTATLLLGHAVLMWFLPRLVPPMPFPAGRISPFSLAAELLTGAAVAEETPAGWILLAGLFGLLSAFCAVYTQVRVPLEGHAHKRSRPLQALSFRSLRLFRAELVSHVPLFALAGAATGLASGFMLGPQPDRTFNALLALETLLVWNLLAVYLIVPYSWSTGVPRPFRGLLGHPASLYVLRTSPYARGAYFLQLYLGALARTGLQVFLSVSIYAGMLGWTAGGRDVLGYLPLLFLCLVLPATALGQAVELLSFRPRDPQWFSLVWFLVWMLAVIWLGMSTGFLYDVPTTVLLWRTAALTAVYGAAAGGMLAWAAWRVEKMDWV